jgi:hypothetical protein
VATYKTIQRFSSLCLAAVLGACGGNVDTGTGAPAQARTATRAEASVRIAEVTPGEWRAYDISWTAGKLVGIAKATGLKNFEVNVPEVRLPDTSLNFDRDGTAGQIFRLYQAAFGRVPDAGGFGFWKDSVEHKGVTLLQVAQGFLDSAESKKLYGVDVDDTLFLKRCYQNVLHREPDAGGAGYWMTQLRSGMKRAEVLIFFANSDENKSAVAPAQAKGMPFVEPNVAYIPVSNATGPGDVTVGMPFLVDGSTSTDANGDLLKYQWTITSRPLSSNATLANPTIATPGVKFDQPGTYELSLRVSDATSQSYSPAKLTIVAHAVVPDSGVYTCASLETTRAEMLYMSGHTYLDRDKDGIPCTLSDYTMEKMPPVATVADTGTYNCSSMSHATAVFMYSQGHTYLDRDHDGKPCEATDIQYETTYMAPYSPSAPSTGGTCYVSGYTRKNGTHVSGYTRRC